MLLEFLVFFSHVLYNFNAKFTLLSLKNGLIDECKTHLCFEFISHAILSILFPYSCKTHNISSKLGFVGFFDRKQVI